MLSLSTDPENDFKRGSSVKQPGRAVWDRLMYKVSGANSTRLGFHHYLKCKRGCEPVFCGDHEHLERFSNMRSASSFVREQGWSCSVCTGNLVSKSTYVSLQTHLRTMYKSAEIARVLNSYPAAAYKSAIENKALPRSTASIDDIFASRKFLEEVLPAIKESKLQLEDVMICNVALDAASVLKRSSMLPVLFQFCNLPPSMRMLRDNLFCGACVPYRKKYPLDYNLLLLIIELSHLGRHGLVIYDAEKQEKRRIFVLLHAFIADSVGAGEIAGLQAPRGHHGCIHCVAKGEPFNGHGSYFTHTQCGVSDLRSTKTLFKNDFGQKHFPLFSLIPFATLPMSIAYDKFHGFANGTKKVAKTLSLGIKSILGKSKSRGPQDSSTAPISAYLSGLTERQRKTIATRASSLNVPSNFGRTPRDPVENLHNFIVEDWFSFANVTGPMLFFTVHSVSRANLKEAEDAENKARRLNGIHLYYASLSMFMGFQYLSRRDTSAYGRKHAHLRITDAHKVFSELHPKLMVPSMHGAKHAIDSFRYLGPLCLLHMAVFERYMQILKDDTRSRLYVESGIMRRVVGRVAIGLMRGANWSPVVNLQKSCSVYSANLDLERDGNNDGGSGRNEDLRDISANNQSRSGTLISRGNDPKSIATKYVLWTSSKKCLDAGYHYMDSLLVLDEQLTIVHQINFLKDTYDLDFVKRILLTRTGRARERLALAKLNPRFFGRFFDLSYGSGIVGERARFNASCAVLHSSLYHKLRLLSHPNSDPQRTSTFVTVTVSGENDHDEEKEYCAELVSFIFAAFDDEDVEFEAAAAGDGANMSKSPRTFDSTGTATSTAGPSGSRSRVLSSTEESRNRMFVLVRWLEEVHPLGSAKYNNIPSSLAIDVHISVYSNSYIYIYISCYRNHA
jgi:hypothetical protein